MRARGLKLKMFCDWFLKSESTQNMKSFYVLQYTIFFYPPKFSLSGFPVKISFFFNYRKTFRVLSPCIFSFLDISNVIFSMNSRNGLGCYRLLSVLGNELFYTLEEKTAYGIYNKDSILIDGVGNVSYTHFFRKMYNGNCELIIVCNKFHE